MFNFKSFHCGVL
jgi:alpha-D-xyloside xylohydrolase